MSGRGDSWVKSDRLDTVTNDAVHLKLKPRNLRHLVKKGRLVAGEMERRRKKGHPIWRKELQVRSE